MPHLIYMATPVSVPAPPPLDTQSPLLALLPEQGDIDARTLEYNKEANVMCRILTMLMSMVDPVSKLPVDVYTILPPPLTFAEYIKRLLIWVKCPDSCFICAIVLFARLIHHGYAITEHSAHKAFAACLLCAIKLASDANTIGMQKLGNVMGISPEALGRLELEFLHHMQFEIYVRWHMYARYCRAVRELLITADVEVDFVKIGDDIIPFVRLPPIK